MKNNYPLASSSWDNLELTAIQNVIKSDVYSMGPMVKKFEDEFANFLGTNYCVMVNSGSSANLLMIAALTLVKNTPLKRGDEVIVPAVSWSTTYTPLHQYGLKLKFVDVDPETLNFDLDELASAINSNTKLILAVNLLGNPNDFARIQSMIENTDITLVEDNCESMGAENLQGKKTGTFGLMGTFSSFFSHHISTMEGGLIATDDEEIYHLLLSLRSHGWTRHLPQSNQITGEKNPDPFVESYKFVLPGYNVRPIEMSGAIGIEQLKKLPNFVSLRRKNAQFFQSLFSEFSFLTIQKEIGRSSWFGFSIILKEGLVVDRAKVLSVLKENAIEYRPIVGGNFTKNPVISYFDYSIHGKLKNSDLVDNNGFFIGNHHFDIQDKITHLHDLIKALF